MPIDDKFNNFVELCQNKHQSVKFDHKQKDIAEETD